LVGWESLSDAIATDANQFGGAYLNRITQLLIGADIAVGDSTLAPIIGTKWTFKSGKLWLQDVAGTHTLNIIPDTQTVDTVIKTPLQTFTPDYISLRKQSESLENKTLDGSKNTFLLVPDSALSANVDLLNTAGTTTALDTFLTNCLGLRNPANTFTTTLNSGATAGAITITLPTIANTLVGRTTTDTLTGKTMDYTLNTFLNFPGGSLPTGVNTGDLAKYSGSAWVLLPRGSASYLLSMNGSGNDVVWAAPPSGTFSNSSVDTYTNKTLDGALNTFPNSAERANITFYLAGTTYKYKHWGNGLTVSNSDFSTLINGVMSSFASVGGYFTFLGHLFTLTAPISVPTQFDARSFTFQGVYSNIRNLGTTFLFDPTTFPTGRGAFEALAANGTQYTPSINASDMFFWNTNPNRTDAATYKINTEAFIIESDRIGDTSTVGNIFQRINTQNMYRGIHMKGGVYGVAIRDCSFNDVSSATFLFDSDIYAERGGHLLAGNSPRNIYISNVFNAHAGLLTASLYLSEGGYTVINNYIVDGTKYTKAPIYLDNSNTIVATGFKVLDLNSASPSGVLGTCVFDNGSYQNQFMACGFPQMNNSPNNYSVAFLNGSHDNTVQVMHFGAIPRINDAAGTAYNYIEMIGDTNPASDLKLLSAQNFANIRVRDFRKGARARGLSATQSGDGSTKVFNIAHGCFAGVTPAYVMVQPALAAAEGNFILSADGTNIIITYPIAPQSGTNNLQWYYNAEVYA
jgi:hypothetical protein